MNNELLTNNDVLFPTQRQTQPLKLVWLPNWMVLSS